MEPSAVLACRTGMKTCTKCGETKTLDLFVARARSKDGRTTHCKACAAASFAAWRERNPERMAVLKREWEQNNPDRLRAQTARYRAAHRAELLAASRERAAADPAHKAEANRKWREQNPDADRARGHRRRVRKAGLVPRDYRGVLRLDCESRCAYCGDAATTVDHVVPISRGGDNSLTNLVPACAPCNSSKRDRLLSEWAGRVTR